ncbi:MAG: hypothetical protein LBS97_02070 [Treponema sp.]|jgi:hypothetical protein|nr:hypothetical protein [Treponema sp.]
MAVLTEQEKPLADRLLETLRIVAPENLSKALGWLSLLDDLEKNIMRFPSLFEPSSPAQNKILFGGQQSALSLLDSLLENREGDKMLCLPALATLGKGFLAAKYHVFNFFIAAAEKAGMSEQYIQELKNTTTALIFTLMAEDVYLNLLDDRSVSETVRRQVALALIILWERRSDFIINENHMAALQEVWAARKNLVPVFGTMMGMSELMLLSMDLGDMWSAFLKQKLSNHEVRLSLEEFLMGLPYEQIRSLRKILREKGISAINRDEISSFLHEEIKTGAAVDADDFYMMYTVRRDNARVRQRLHHEGPKNTLEDHYMAFVFEEYRKRDFNGITICI